jgi:hypothetical protein
VSGVKNKKDAGAASVLVVFMMLVLVTLGAFAIAAANANYKLSQRALNWNAMYYDLDAAGEEYLAKIDLCLARAEAKAWRYMRDWENDTELPEDLRADSALISENPGQVFNRVYLHYSNKYLTELTIDQPIINLYTMSSGNVVSSLNIYFTVMSERDGNENCGLEVNMWAEPPVSVDAAGETAQWPGGKRYAIQDWYEFQMVEEVAEPMNIWDGTFDFGF